MTCATCGKHVSPLSAVTEGGATFCSRACLDEWRKKHGAAPAGGRPKAPDEAAAAPLEFPMDPPGFERRGMRLRLSYWTAPKLFLDGKLLAPVNGGIFARARHYRVLNNAGKETDVALRRRPLDQIPEITIDGVVYPVVRPLNAWEYVWMGLPALLLVVGGALGGAIGLSAVFVNSILMRRMRNRVARYLFTGVTTALAAMMFVQSSTFVRPLLESFGLRGGTIEGRIREAAAEVNRNCPVSIDQETRLDSASGGPGAMLTYHYTLVRSVAAAIDTARLRQYLRPNVITTIRTQESMKILRDNNVTFLYRYLDRNGVLAFELRVPPEEYRQ